MQCNKSKRRLPRFARGFAAVCAALAVAAAGGASAAPTETVLYNFCSLPGCSDGNGLVAGLIADSAGNLYGTTQNGGVGGAAGFGVVFKLSPGGTETVLHSFTGGPSDGAGPAAGLLADSAGNLYGTTNGGGASNAGVVFKLSPGGTETVLYSFCSLPGCSDGLYPFAGLIADSAGNLYGTTTHGGAPRGCRGSGCGVVFKLSPGGTETVLHAFTGINHRGRFPETGLIADSAGNLYGTTAEGGRPGCGGAVGCGVVFKLSPGGTETVLHSFTGGDGANPQAGLIADSAGNLYGTTTYGGAPGGCGGSGCGVVFKLSPGGTETALYSFCSAPSCFDGFQPIAGLIADSAGNLYGTTGFGGASGNGVVFKLSPGGTETVLHSFCSLPGCSDGTSPGAGLIADSAGNLYGTTQNGGSGCSGPGCGGGVVFKLAGTGFVTPAARRSDNDKQKNSSNF